MKLNFNIPLIAKILRWLGIIVLGFFALSILSVIVFRFVNPPVTPLMLIRYFEHDTQKGPRKIARQWKKINDISPNMVLAVVAAEDNNFTLHNGIDWEAIEKARERNKRSKRKYGGSTISQQTVKNVFLVPSRTLVRKAFEVYFVYVADFIWGKKRMMEIYLNIVELGPGVYGVEAASQKYFKKSAKYLSRSEAALLATALPAPLKRNPAKPGPYILRHQQRIISIMDKIGKVDLSSKRH